MNNRLARVPIGPIENAILLIRGEKVILDSDIARLYGVTTKRLNEQVKRNPDRFPKDFMFKLTKDEKAEVVANCDHLSNLKFSPGLPLAFTEYGAIMAANVLNSSRAVQTSLEVIRAFIRLRQFVTSDIDLACKLRDLERKYDNHFKVVFDAIRELMTPPEPKRKQIGFRVKVEE